MYRVGLIINENEASHSKYADTETTLKLAIDDCNRNGRKGNSYHLVVYDQFTINTLFDSRQNDIATLNALVIATNALSFGNKIHTVLCDNKHRIEEFLDRHKGVFISSQKKLSNGSLSVASPRSVGFLPDAYDYYLFDRPEKSSADGSITIAASSILLDYPYGINNDLIDKHCNNNQFMVHKYRAIIIPIHPTTYESILCDVDSPPVSQPALNYLHRERKVLLYSGGSRRIVISTMALDWANHAELLCNILTTITECEPRLFFVKKHTEEPKSPLLDSYMIRTNIANIPYRAIAESELKTCPASAGNAFVFSPAWTPQEIETVYAAMLHSQRGYFTIHHISTTNVPSDKNHKLIKYRNYSSIDIMKDAVILSILSSFQTTGWGKSVWTYSYVSDLLDFYRVQERYIAKGIYQELERHFTKADAATGNRTLSGDYDGVFNATCKMLDVLNVFTQTYGDDLGKDLPYEPKAVITSAEAWMLARVEKGAVFDQDICYCVLYLMRFGKFTVLDAPVRTRLMSVFTSLLTRIAEEVLSGGIVRRSSVDLCRVHQALCRLSTDKAVAPKELPSYIAQIESTLRARQDIHGNWKNISETAEITLMLLESYNARANINIDLNMLNTLIANGIVALESQYNANASMWADDIGATAKAMHAIALYDRVFQFSINDFFSDLKIHRERALGMPEELTKERIGNFYRVIDDLGREKDLLSREVIQIKGQTHKIRSTLSKTRYALTSTIAVLVGTLAIMGLFGGILYVDHRDILIKVLGDWRTVLEGAVAGVIATVVLSEAVRLLSKKDSKD
jgi:hypothetical protein